MGGRRARVPVFKTTRAAENVLFPDPDAEGVRLASGEPRVAAQEPRVLRALEAAPQARASLHDDASRAIQNRGEIDFDRGDPKAEHGSPPRLKGRARGRDHRLRGGAAEVHAGAAQVLAFRQRDCFSGLRERMRERNARLTASDDQDVVPRLRRHRLLRIQAVGVR